MCDIIVMAVSGLQTLPNIELGSKNHSFVNDEAHINQVQLVVLHKTVTT